MEDALRLLSGGLPDVILTDIGLPGMSGTEGIRILKARFPDIPIVALTVYDHEGEIFDALCAGANGYLLKNTPPARLLDCLAEEQFRLAVQLEPNNPSRHENLGRLLYLSTKYSEAATALKQAISLAPNLAGPHYLLGLTLVSQKRYIEAETEFNLVLRINPNDTEAKKDLAALQRRN